MVILNSKPSMRLEISGPTIIPALIFSLLIFANLKEFGKKDPSEDKPLTDCLFIPMLMHTYGSNDIENF